MSRSAFAIAACLPVLTANLARGADAASPQEESPVKLGASLKLEWASAMPSGSSQKLQLSFQPELTVELPAELRLTAIGRYRGDGSDDLEPGDPDLEGYSRLTRPAALGERGELELRELYLDGSVGPALLRLGKQQIVWGEADGLKVLDVVNPQDFREFILDDFEDSRIPLWAANLELPFGSSVLQLLFVPDPTVHHIPGLDSAEDPDEAFGFTAPMFRPDKAVNLRLPVVGVLTRDSRPTWRMRDSDVGARLSTVWRGWDLSLNFLSHIDDSPVIERGQTRFRIEDRRLKVFVDVMPRFERNYIAGGTFSRSVGSLTIRGEAIHTGHRAYTTVDPGERDGILRRNELSYVLGLDWFGTRDWFLSGQLFQTVILDREQGMIRDGRDTTLTVMARRTLWNDRLRLEVIALYGAHHADGLVRPRVEYQIDDRSRIWVGGDVFFGSTRGVFGQFDRQDRWLIGFEWQI